MSRWERLKCWFQFHDWMHFSVQDIYGITCKHRKCHRCSHAEKFGLSGDWEIVD